MKHALDSSTNSCESPMLHVQLALQVHRTMIESGMADSDQSLLGAMLFKNFENHLRTNVLGKL